MFVIRKIPKKLIVLLAAAAVLLTILLVLDAVSASAGAAAVSVALDTDDDMARANFLAQYGWEISTVPTEVCEITIPEEFDAVYITYNDLQKSQGFDLQEYAGQRVKRYTYSITNYPDGITGVKANILQFDNKIIGGDICTMELNGFMHGFDSAGTGIMRQTLYNNAAHQLY